MGDRKSMEARNNQGSKRESLNGRTLSRLR